jgi:hypothetical protein
MGTALKKDRERAMGGLGAHGWSGRISWILGIIFAIVGVISELMNTTFGLAPTSWYLLSIAAFASSAGMIVSWTAGLILWAVEGKREK